MWGKFEFFDFFENFNKMWGKFQKNFENSINFEKIEILGTRKFWIPKISFFSKLIEISNFFWNLPHIFLKPSKKWKNSNLPHIYLQKDSHFNIFVYYPLWKFAIFDDFRRFWRFASLKSPKISSFPHWPGLRAIFGSKKLHFPLEIDRLGGKLFFGESKLE